MTDPLSRQSMTGRPVEFWGLKAIAQRMGFSVGYLRRLRDEMHFPAIVLPNPRRRHRRNMAFKWCHYTNEDLIAKWYLAQANVQRTWRKRYGGRWWEQVWKVHRGELMHSAEQKPPRARESESERAAQ